MAYASDTSVSVDRSIAEIKNLVLKRGASGFQFTQMATHAQVMFELNNRVIRFVLQLPPPDAQCYTQTPSGRKKRASAQVAAMEQDQRARFRALVLSIKAKLVAVEQGIAEFEDEFLANIVVPGGETVSALVRPQIVQAYESKRAPKLLLGTGT